MTYNQRYNRWKAKYVPDLSNEILKQCRQAAEFGSVSDDGVRKSVSKIHSEVGVFMAGHVSRSVRKQAGLKLSPREIWERVIRIYFESYGLNLVVEEIGSTTMADIRRILVEQSLMGSPITEIMKYIESVGYPTMRAERIARTEIAKAQGTGSMVGALSTGLETVKEWISARDDRTRRVPRNQFDHLHMDGKQVGLDEYFEVPTTLGIKEQALFPGDAGLSAGNVINCRCTTGYTVVRDRQGRPKQIQSPPKGQAGIIYNLLKNQI